MMTTEIKINKNQLTDVENLLLCLLPKTDYACYQKQTMLAIENRLCLLPKIQKKIHIMLCNSPKNHLFYIYIKIRRMMKTKKMKANEETWREKKVKAASSPVASSSKKAAAATRKRKTKKERITRRRLNSTTTPYSIHSLTHLYDLLIATHRKFNIFLYYFFFYFFCIFPLYKSDSLRTTELLYCKERHTVNIEPTWMVEYRTCACCFV